MSPLNLDFIDPKTKEWRRFGTLNPGDLPGSISDHKDDGSRDVYLFECDKDGKTSTINRSVAGVDIETGQAREVFSAGFEEVAKLRDGEALTMPIRNGRGQEITVRFTHAEKR